MNILTTDKAISLLPADDDSIELGLFRLSDLSGENVSPDQIRAMVEDGALQANTLLRDGEPFAVIFWQANPATKTVNAAAANIQNGENFSDIMTALEYIARQSGCDFVQFQTRRAGIARMAARCGWTVDTVCCLKRIQ